MGGAAEDDPPLSRETPGLMLEPHGGELHPQFVSPHTQLGDAYPPIFRLPTLRIFRLLLPPRRQCH